MSKSIFDLSNGNSSRPITATLGGTTFWAERGLVHYQNDGKTDVDEARYASLPVKDVLMRLKAIDLVRKTLPKAELKNHKLIREHDKFVHDLMAVCREASRQGSPFNPDAVRERVSNLKRSRITTIDPTTKTVNPDGSFNPSVAFATQPRRKI